MSKRTGVVPLDLGSGRGKHVRTPEMVRCRTLLTGYRECVLEASVHRRRLFLVNYLPPRTPSRPTMRWAVLLFNSCYKIGQHLTDCNLLLLCRSSYEVVALTGTSSVNCARETSDGSGHFWSASKAASRRRSVSSFATQSTRSVPGCRNRKVRNSSNCGPFVRLPKDVSFGTQVLELPQAGALGISYGRREQWSSPVSSLNQLWRLFLAVTGHRSTYAKEFIHLSLLA